MNLFDSSFLCLDIGTSGVRGLAYKIRGARIDQSAFFTVDSYDTTFAIKSVIDELEKQIGAHFDSAYITGNFGPSAFDIVAKNTTWTGEHKINAGDVKNQIAQITPPDGFFPMHIIPLQYVTPQTRKINSPIGLTDRQLISAFGTIFYSREGIDKIYDFIRGAHIQPDIIYDPQHLMNAAVREKGQTIMFIDFGAQFTSASIWTDRGPVWHTKIALGGTDITHQIMKKFGLDFESAERIKRAVASMIQKSMDRFAPADRAYSFSCSDVNEVVLPVLLEIIAKIKDECAKPFTKYRPTKIIIGGGGANIEGLRDFIENAFAVVTEIKSTDAVVQALADFVWAGESERCQNYIARHDRWANRANWFRRIFKKKPKKQQKNIPIMPSTLAFNMRRQDTYSLFRAGGISMIHVDIMDGLYVDRISGSIEELEQIRAHTDAHLHVHLMTESPTVWAAAAVNAGADTVIMSTNTSGLRAALRAVRATGKRAGVALNPDSSVLVIKKVLREVDEIMIMAVNPGASGQKFNPSVLNKISLLAAARKKYGYTFAISVDGGINPETAQLCWQAGADMLVSGSYLAKASDFPLAVQSLMRKYPCDKK